MALLFTPELVLRINHKLTERNEVVSRMIVYRDPSLSLRLLQSQEDLIEEEKRVHVVELTIVNIIGEKSLLEGLKWVAGAIDTPFGIFP